MLGRRAVFSAATSNSRSATHFDSVYPVPTTTRGSVIGLSDIGPGGSKLKSGDDQGQRGDNVVEYGAYYF